MVLSKLCCLSVVNGVINDGDRMIGGLTPLGSSRHVTSLHDTYDMQCVSRHAARQARHSTSRLFPVPKCMG